MALTKINKSPTPINKEIRYLSKTFSDFRQNLIDFTKVYFPQTYTDFSEASPGMLFIEMASYVGDVLGYYIDANFRENLMLYTEEVENVISIAQSMGYKAKPTAAATCDLDVYQLCPATDITGGYAPDANFYLRLAPGATFQSEDFAKVTFRTIDEINFADPTDREISIYATDINNKPLTYLIKKTVTVVAGTVKTFTATFGSAQKFSIITLPDDDIIDVISVVDGNGNTWYQVDYLAQDLIFQDIINTNTTSDPNFSVPPAYIANIVSQPRRFVTRYNENFKLELHFGSGLVSDNSSIINLEPKKLANSEYQTNLVSTSLDPSDFLSSNSYGIAPSNIDLIITYSIGGGVESNVSSNSITKVVTITPLNDITSFSPSELNLWNDVVQSVASNNSSPATGGAGQDDVESIRQNALAFFNAQNRLVTVDDYIVRCYAMPPKYGSVAKVFVTKDDQINNILRATQGQPPVNGVFVQDTPGHGMINLYVLGFNQQQKISTLNLDTKNNLKTYLDQYRMLTDNVRIMDGFVVNFGVTFKVVVYRNYNMNEVLTRCIDAISSFFNINNWQMNQPIVINDVYLTLGSVDGVQSVIDVEFFNRYSFQDGSDYSPYLYDLTSATSNGVIWPSLDPAIFELRYPERDIIGNAIQ